MKADRSLEVDALLSALLAIRTLAEARTTNKLHVTTHTREGVSQTERFEGQLPYDPACVFHLEMMVSLASRGKQHIGETWYVACLMLMKSLICRPIIFEYISSLLNSAQSFSVLLIERAVVGLLRLCLIVSETVSRLLRKEADVSPSYETSYTLPLMYSDRYPLQSSTQSLNNSWQA
jgi:brefeldin A-resistance guanine nucleotide exchange factor 1